MKTNGIPVHLFLEQRPCLVVGGGKSALQKVRLLLDAQAIVLVVAPEVDSELLELEKTEAIQIKKRPFESADIIKQTLVFATTGNRKTNREILTYCREHNILCSCVDGNWTESDFTLPSILRQSPLTLSVTANNTDNQLSKMVKNSLARHLTMIESATLVIVGTDHHHLNVEEREPFHLTGHRFERAGFMIMQLWGIHEFMILNTCNRVELIAIVSEQTARNGILRHILGFTTLKEDKFYIKRDQEAFEHLCLVTAGMRSQTPGENHITAQIKEALDTAQQHQWANSLLQNWISSALHVSKAIKNKIAPLLTHYEIEELAIRYLQNTLPDLSHSTLMVLGAGTIGHALVNQSLPLVKKIIWCYHINPPTLPEDPEKKIQCGTFNSLREHLHEADIIISATDSPGHLLLRSHAPFLNQEGAVTIVDLGMPRNIDPELDTLSSRINVVDLDGLKYWYRRELTDLEALLQKSREVISAHDAEYQKMANRLHLSDESENIKS